MDKGVLMRDKACDIGLNLGKMVLGPGGKVTLGPATFRPHAVGE